MLVACVILYATLADHPAGADEFPAIPHIDKLIHAIMFGGLAGAIIFDRTRAYGAAQLCRRAMLKVCLWVALGGIADELMQHYLSDVRAGDHVDWLADCAGIAVAFVAAPPAIRKVLKVK